MSVRRSRKNSSKNSAGSVDRNGTSAQKRERPPCTTARKGKGDAVRANRRTRRRKPGAGEDQLSRFRRTARFLFGNRRAVARSVVVIGALGAAIYFFDLKIEVFGVTFSAAETCHAEVVEPPAPLQTYPVPYTPVPLQPAPLYPPQSPNGQDQAAVAPTA
ncbi:hypothetical protein LFM09_42025 [Lentzea alba]|uniref:hypothetical protein n=1 Tax=Lentzea alba TaxID=2714351 RepID=UPI0039BF224D